MDVEEWDVHVHFWFWFLTVALAFIFYFLTPIQASIYWGITIKNRVLIN